MSEKKTITVDPSLLSSTEPNVTQQTDNWGLEEKPLKEDSNTQSEDAVEKEPEYDTEELLAIFDDMMFEGSYSESIVVRKKLSFKLRSRSAGEEMNMSRELDRFDSNLLITFERYRTLLGLAYSLVEYNGTSLTDRPPSSFGLTDKEAEAFKGKTRYDFLTRLPTPVVFLMANKLVDFDKKVFAAVKEGEANF